jgi:hypothetical protein
MRACTAFATPLLSIAGLQSFTICIVGLSQSDRNIAALIAGLTMGTRKSSDFITLNITGAQLEQRLNNVYGALHLFWTERMSKSALQSSDDYAVILPYSSLVVPPFLELYAPTEETPSNFKYLLGRAV